MFRVWTHKVDAQHLIYWQGQCVCDALFCFQVFSSGSYVLPHHIIIVFPHSFFKVPQNVLNLFFNVLMQFPNNESFFLSYIICPKLGVYSFVISIYVKIQTPSIKRKDTFLESNECQVCSGRM